MSERVSPFLAQLARDLGVPTEGLTARWKSVCERVSRSRGASMESMTADDFLEAQETIKSEVLREIEEDPMNPARFIESPLDAKRYLETVFVQSSPDGQETYDDDGRTKLLTNPAQGFKAAGLMAPSGSVGESLEDDGVVVGLKEPIVPGPEPSDDIEPIVSRDDEIARLAAEAADLVLGKVKS